MYAHEIRERIHDSQLLLDRQRALLLPLAGLSSVGLEITQVQTALAVLTLRLNQLKDAVRREVEYSSAAGHIY